MAINMNIREILPEGAIILDNSAFDNSIIGVTLDGRLIYDYDKMIEELIEDDGMSLMKRWNGLIIIQSEHCHMQEAARQLSYRE